MRTKPVVSAKRSWGGFSVDMGVTASVKRQNPASSSFPVDMTLISRCLSFWNYSVLTHLLNLCLRFSWNVATSGRPSLTTCIKAGPPPSSHYSIALYPITWFIFIIALITSWCFWFTSGFCFFALSPVYRMQVPFYMESFRKLKQYLAQSPESKLLKGGWVDGWAYG